METKPLKSAFLPRLGPFYTIRSVHPLAYARYASGSMPDVSKVLPNYGRFPSFQVLMASTLRALTDKWNEVIEDGSK